MTDFVQITSNDNWFKQHPEKIAGVEYETTSFYFPIMVKGTKEDVLRVTGMHTNTDKMKRLQLAKAKAKAIKIKLGLSGKLGGLVALPNSKLILSEIKKLTKSLDIKDKVSVIYSKTSFGESIYIKPYDVFDNRFKIRISDHGVSNIDRIFNEIHYSFKDFEIEHIKEELEKIFYPKLFITKTKKIIEKRISGPTVFESLEDFKDKTHNVISFEIKREFKNKKGKEKIEIEWSYPVEKEVTYTFRKGTVHFHDKNDV